MAGLELFRGTKITEKNDLKTQKAASSADAEDEPAPSLVEGDRSSHLDDQSSEVNVLTLLKSLRSSLLESSEAIIDGIDLEAPTGGMSLLALKNLLMTDYLKNLLILVKSKLKPHTSKSVTKAAQDESESTEKVTERLVELRVILERIRPVESKLKALIDRLIRQANQEKNFQYTGVSKESETRVLRPRPEDMVLDDEDEEGGESKEEEDKEGSDEEEGSEKDGNEVKKYKPPQLSAAYYDPGWEESAAGANRRGKTRTSTEHRLMMQEMLARAEGDEPEEITNEEEGMGFLTASEKRRKQMEERHRQRFEEEHFIRLPAEKGKRQLPTVGTADKVLLYGRDGADDDDLRVFASNDGSEMPVGYGNTSEKRFKKLQKRQKRKQNKKGRAKSAKRAKRARRK